MTEHDDLRELLSKAPPPAPDAATRARDIDAATAAFDAAEESSTTAQGIADAPRPKARQSGLMTLWRRVMTFELPSTRSMMMGGASLAVLMLAVVAIQPQLHDHNQQPGSLGGVLSMSGGESTEPEPVAANAPTEDGNAVVATETERTEATGSEATVAARQDTPADSQLMSSEEIRQQIERQRASMNDQNRGTFADEGLRRGVTSFPDDAAEQAAAQPAPAKPQPTTEFHRFSRKGVIAERRLEMQPSSPEADRSQLREFSGGSTLGVDQDAEAQRGTYQEQGRDRFEDVELNQVKLTTEEPVSTFSIDVDTASYSFMRQALTRGVLPPRDSIRIEELINYFSYDYAPPESRETPFSTHVTVMPTPWNEGTQLLRIGIQGYELAEAEKPRSNLVFLLDTSGSMNAPDKLPLLIQSFEMLVSSLHEDDTVSIVVYAGSAGTVLEPTRVAEKARILDALQRLRAGGSTAGGEGIRQAYKLAEQNFDPEGINRVILATDGDFNVGISDPEELKGFVERKRDTGVFLSVLGFGRGNYNDQLMQTLAQNGNGNAAYIDTIQEAQKTLVDESSSTLFPIAKDVKIQVDFNPNVVAEYRLIGYETRMLNRQDFNNDRVDAGEIGAGHSVTALYEITAPDSEARLLAPSRYSVAEAESSADVRADEYAFLKIRYKQPESDESILIERPVTKVDQVEPDTEARFAAAVAGFGQLLRDGRHLGSFSFDDVLGLALGARGEDTYGYRAEFIRLVRLAKTAAAMERQQ